MASNKKKDKAIKFFSVFSVILCFFAFCGGFVKSQSEDLYYDFENKDIVKISCSEDITTIGESIYNDECVLVNDIHITDNAFRIGTTGKPFSGTFDGNGHTIYIDFNTVTQNTSLFSCIEASGVIKNTRFVFEGIIVDGNTYGGIAKINYGTIKDCKIECAQILINNDVGIYSPCVVINKGMIANVVVDCSFANSQIYENEESILFGGICTYNYGTIKNCISAPTFNNIICSDEFKILVGETVNVGISAICAVNMSNSLTTNSVAILKTGVYTADKNSGLLIAGNYSDITNENVFFFELDFNNRVWKIQEKEIVLIQG